MAVAVSSFPALSVKNSRRFKGKGRWEKALARALNGIDME
jgi:hypothetical protein